jgi:hypothetical protein
MIILQCRRKRAESIRRPPFVGPCSAGIEQRITPTGPIRRFARRGGLDLIEWKFGWPRRNADRPQKSKIDVHDVPRFSRIVDTAAARIERARIKDACERFARVGCREADDARRAGKSRDHRGFEKALQVDGDVVALPAETANSRPKRQATSRAASIVDRQASIDHRHEVEQLPVLRADEPIDSGRRDYTPNRSGDRNRVHDIAERAEADNEEPRSHWSQVTNRWSSRKSQVLRRTHPRERMRARRSRVAWVFASPTIAVRPP